MALFSGPWVMNADGWKFTLNITQADDNNTVTGTMTGINNDNTNTITGTVNGEQITFTRDSGPSSGQEFQGYMFSEDPANTGSNNQSIAGVASHSANNFSFGWYATR